MAGKGGGGAWKVAYADFVTAMMAFFLVMWICGQDQKVRRSVSDYFSDPMGSPDASSSKKPSRAGSLADSLMTGSVPDQEKVAMGKGGKTFSQLGMTSPSTKLINDWLHRDKKTFEYWQKQAKELRESARLSKDVRDKTRSEEQAAVAALVLQLQDEILRDMPLKTDDLYRGLLQLSFRDVNWLQLAEHIMGQ